MKKFYLSLLVLSLLLTAWAVLPGRAALAERSPLADPAQAAAAATATPTPTPGNTGATPGNTGATATPTPAASLAVTSTLVTPAPVIRVTGYDVNLRDGPGNTHVKLDVLDYNEKLTLLGHIKDNSWLYVRTSDGQEGWVLERWVDHSGIYLDRQPLLTPAAPPIPTPMALPGVQGRWIDIDITDQMLYAFEDSTIVGSFLVSTGVEQFPTVTGQYHIRDKVPFQDMRGEGYNLPRVPFTMHYNLSFSIHGTYWHHNFGTRMSHGCINMDTKDAEWLYNWASVGTLVNIHW